MVILMILFGIFFRRRTVPDSCRYIPDTDHADGKGYVSCGTVRKKGSKNAGYVAYGWRRSIIQASANEPA